MDPPDRRLVSLAGLSLVGAGAVLGLALAVPSTAAVPDSPRPASSDSAPVVEKDLPER